MSKEKHSAFEIIIEIFGWLLIVASPFLIGSVVGFVVYLANPDVIGIVIGISIASLGLIIGITWATRAWKRKGTIEFISRVSATPELDDPEKEEEQQDIKK